MTGSHDAHGKRDLLAGFKDRPLFYGFWAFIAFLVLVLAGIGYRIWSTPPSTEFTYKDAKGHEQTATGSDSCQQAIVQGSSGTTPSAVLLAASKASSAYSSTVFDTWFKSAAVPKILGMSFKPNRSSKQQTSCDLKTLDPQGILKDSNNHSEKAFAVSVQVASAADGLCPGNAQIFYDYLMGWLDPQKTVPRQVLSPALDPGTVASTTSTAPTTTATPAPSSSEVPPESSPAPTSPTTSQDAPPVSTTPPTITLPSTEITPIGP